MHQGLGRTRKYALLFLTAQFLTFFPALSTSSLPIPLTLPTLTTALKPAIAAKQYGSEDLLAPLVAEAALSVIPIKKTSKGTEYVAKDFNVDNVRVVKILGGSLSSSRVVRGMVFPREPEGLVRSSDMAWVTSDKIAGVIKKVTKAKVVVFTCGLDIAQTETKGTVLLKNAKEMLNFTTDEEKHMEKVIPHTLFSMKRHPNQLLSIDH